MTDDRWFEIEHGTVIRRYFHVRGANEEMRSAQHQGWSVQSVSINGKVVDPDSSGLRWPWRTRLVQDRKGTFELRSRGASREGNWCLQPGPWPLRIKETEIQVTYMKPEEGKVTQP